MSEVIKEENLQDLVDALLKCDCMKTRQGRQNVVDRLPDPIPEGIGRRDTAREDVENILRRCLQFLDHPNSLPDAMRPSDGGTIWFANVERLWKKYLLKPFSEMTGPHEKAAQTEPGTNPGTPNGTKRPGGEAPQKNPGNETPPRAGKNPGKNETPQPALWEKIAAFSFGVVFVGVMLYIALYVPDPSPFQYRVFRMVMALAAAGIGAVVPGLLQVQVNQKYMPVIRAGGAIALFVIVYLIDPPKM